MSKNPTDNTWQRTETETQNVLIVDEDPELARPMLRLLAQRGIRGIIADSIQAAIELIEKGSYSLVFAAEQIRPKAGLPPQPKGAYGLLRKIKTEYPEMSVIMILENRSENPCGAQSIADAAVTAIQAGCCDCLIKPPDLQKARSLLEKWTPNHSVRCCDSADLGIRNLYRIVGRSEKLLQAVWLARKIAPTSAPVLISGESGTGKELFSYLIHHNSKRAHGPYVRVNCAALSDSLLESELFGHEKGAFTGAHARRKGRFEMAHGGTLLLDEITETPLRLQAKLLRVLEQQTFERVGGNDNVEVNVRILSTTNKDLPQEVMQGSFRQDLYYRLSGIRLVVSPLRKRREDLIDLVWHFVNLYAHESQRQITELDPSMMDIFAEYHWPGNVRQLRNVILTSLILGVGPKLSLADVSWLFDELQPRPQQSPASTPNPQTDSGLAGIPLVQIEKRAIMDTLRQTEGNQTRAAKVLGISDRTLRERLRRYRQAESLQPA